MHCPSCGKEIVDGSGFCCYCGARQAPRAGGKRLARSIADKKVAGVCGGFAEYFGLDPTILRILWVFVTVATEIVPGVVAYLVAWFLMPQSSFVPGPAPAPHAARGPETP